MSNSKKICSFYRKHEGVFEGMYGFVSSYYYYLVDNWRSHYEPCHWRYLKIGQIKRNNDNTYSRLNLMNFLQGKKSTKITHHLSSITWLSLCEFCLQHEKSDHFALLELILSKLCERIHPNKSLIQD